FARFSYRHVLFLDYKPAKWYRWSSLKFALNGAARRDYPVARKHIVNVIPVDSRNDEIIQLTDILIGALLYEGPSESPKGQLASRVRELEKERTDYGKQVLEVREFEPSRPNKSLHRTGLSVAHFAKSQN